MSSFRFSKCWKMLRTGEISPASDQALPEYAKMNRLEPPQLEAQHNYNLEDIDIKNLNHITTCLLDQSSMNRFSAKGLLHVLIQLMKSSGGKWGANVEQRDYGKTLTIKDLLYCWGLEFGSDVLVLMAVR